MSYRMQHPRLPGPHEDPSWISELASASYPLSKWVNYASNWNPATDRGLVGGRECAVAFLATGDETYLGKIREWLREFPGTQGPPGWTLSTTMFQAAMFYDWLYGHWTDTERADWRAKLLTCCDQWKKDWEQNYYSPYNSVAYARATCAMGYAMAALWPDPEVVADPAAVALMNWTYVVMFDLYLPALRDMWEGGAWPEGWGYLDGACRTAWPLLEVMRYTMGMPVWQAEAWAQDSLRMVDYCVEPDGTALQVGHENLNIVHLDNAHNWSPFNGYPLVALRTGDPVALGRCGASLDPFWPTMWPWGPMPPQEGLTLPTEPQSELPLYHHFEGAGLVVMKDEWGDERSRFVAAICGQVHGSHQRSAQGHFDWYAKGGKLLAWGGGYVDFMCEHFVPYATCSSAHNCLEIVDPADESHLGTFRLKVSDYPDPFIWIDRYPLPNDGGQRRIGSPFTSHPLTPQERHARDDEFTPAEVVKLERSQDGWYHLRMDLSQAYRPWVGAQGYQGRTERVFENGYIRDLIWKEDILVCVDSLVLIDGTMSVRCNWHTIEPPRMVPPVSGNGWLVELRRQNAVEHQYSWPGGPMVTPDGKYQYTAQGWMQPMLPEGATVTLAGGPSGWAQATDGYGAKNFDSVHYAPYGNHPDWLMTDDTKGPREHGLWKLVTHYPPIGGNARVLAHLFNEGAEPADYEVFPVDAGFGCRVTLNGVTHEISLDASGQLAVTSSPSE